MGFLRVYLRMHQEATVYSARCAQICLGTLALFVVLKIVARTMRQPHQASSRSSTVHCNTDYTKIVKLPLCVFSSCRLMDAIPLYRSGILPLTRARYLAYLYSTCSFALSDFGSIIYRIVYCCTYLKIYADIPMQMLLKRSLLHFSIFRTLPPLIYSIISLIKNSYSSIHV